MKSVNSYHKNSLNRATHTTQKRRSWFRLQSKWLFMGRRITFTHIWSRNWDVELRRAIWWSRGTIHTKRRRKMWPASDAWSRRRNFSFALTDSRMDSSHDRRITTLNNNDEVFIVRPSWEIIECMLSYWPDNSRYSREHWYDVFILNYKRSDLRVQELLSAHRPFATPTAVISPNELNL